MREIANSTHKRPLRGHCAPALSVKEENAGWAVCNGEYFRKITTIYRGDKNYIFAFPAGICIINATLQLYI